MGILHCFVAGTAILTDEGEVPVERLEVGARIITGGSRQGAPGAVRWIGRRSIDFGMHADPISAHPVRVRAGALADSVPHRDLFLSPDHAIYADGQLVAVRQLVNGMTIVQEIGWASVEYFHIELDRHSILLAEGAPAESYLDDGDRGFFENSDSPLILHPSLTETNRSVSRLTDSCAPFAIDEASVRPIWQRFADRAIALGFAPAPVVSTEDPDLRLVAKGRTIRPVSAEDGLYVFPLPLEATGTRIASRASSPTATRPWLDDRRELGVSVKRIVLRTADDVIDLPVDASELTEGWWDVERAGDQLHRWTDGSALVTFPAFEGHAMLEIHLHGTMRYALSEPVAEPPRRSSVA